MATLKMGGDENPTRNDEIGHLVKPRFVFVFNISEEVRLKHESPCDTKIGNRLLATPPYFAANVSYYTTILCRDRMHTVLASCLAEAHICEGSGLNTTESS